MNPRRLIAFLAALALMSLPLHAADGPVFAVRKAAEDLNSATRALKDAREARDRVAALGRAVRAYEDGLRAMRESLRKASIQEQSIRLEFEARRDQLAKLLGILQTLERATTPLLLIHPSGPLGTARSGQILSEITPALNSQAEDLRAQLAELQAIQSLQRQAEESLMAGLKGVQDARVDLVSAIGERTNLPRRFVADKAKLARLAKDSETMNVFARGLADLPFDGVQESEKAFETLKGGLSLPVFGTILRRFNEADAAGLRRPGLVLSAPPVSLVTAPHAATIRFRGPFLDYGNVIILEPGAGYLIVLAGLGQVFGEVGQIVPAGAPVGLLRGQDPSAGDFLVEAKEGSGETRQETLYIEIRRDRKAVNPEEWFALPDR